MESPDRLRPSFLLSAALLLTPLASEAALYCCQDQAGKRVCADTMPQACIGRDTVYKGERGTRVIEGLLSPEERARREEDALKRQRENEARIEQRRLDQALLNTYASSADVDVAKARAEKEVQAQIKVAEDKIAAAQAKQKKLTADLEFYKNKTPPDDLRRALQDAEFEIKAQGELIESKKRDLVAQQAKFDVDKRRYEELVRTRAAPR